MKRRDNVEPPSYYGPTKVSPLQEKQNVTQQHETNQRNMT